LVLAAEPGMSPARGGQFCI